eukprot:4515891-Prymnesium_polylepis.2
MSSAAVCGPTAFGSRLRWDSHPTDRAVVRRHQVEVCGDGQAPRRALRAAVVVALHDGCGEEVAADGRPRQHERVERYHPPAEPVLGRRQIRREPWQVEHGVQVVAVRSNGVHGPRV